MHCYQYLQSRPPQCSYCWTAVSRWALGRWPESRQLIQYLNECWLVLHSVYMSGRNLHAAKMAIIAAPPISATMMAQHSHLRHLDFTRLSLVTYSFSPLKWEHSRGQHNWTNSTRSPRTNINMSKFRMIATVPPNISDWLWNLIHYIILTQNCYKPICSCLFWC